MAGENTPVRLKHPAQEHLSNVSHSGSTSTLASFNCHQILVSSEVQTEQRDKAVVNQKPIKICEYGYDSIDCEETNLHLPNSYLEPQNSQYSSVVFSRCNSYTWITNYSEVLGCSRPLH